MSKRSTPRIREILGSPDPQIVLGGLAQSFLANKTFPSAVGARQGGVRCPRCKGTMLHNIRVADYGAVDYCQSCRIVKPLPQE